MKIVSIFAIIALVLVGMFVVSRGWFGGSLVGKGAIVTRTVSLDEFESVRISGAYERVDFIESDRFELVFDGYENLFENLEVVNRNDELLVRSKMKWVRMTSNVPRLTIYGKTLKRVKLSGATKFYADHIENDDYFEIDASGASDLTIDVKSPRVNVDLSGAGSVKLSGLTRDLNASISGAANIKAYALKAENTDVEITGAGNAEVYASKKLNAKATGAGNIRYMGEPVINVKTSGAGSVRQKN